MALKPHKLNEPGNFIAGWYLDDASVCDELIRYHDESPHKRPGSDQDKQGSTDVLLAPSTLTSRYVQMLNALAREYTTLYPWCMKMTPWGIIEPVCSTHYQPGGAYSRWHFERDNTTAVISRRHLVFMTFLNDVRDGGGIEFHHQKLVVQPEKGLTLIWPSDWTFTHRGIVAPTEHQYIATGWYSTYTQEQLDKLGG